MNALLWKVLAIFCFVLLVTQVNAAEPTDDNWQKPIPSFKQEFDWLKLSSDEWLKGDIISMYDDELEFDSDELDVQVIDWEDVAELRSKGDLSIRFEDGSIIEGSLVIIDGKLTIISQGQAKNYLIGDLLSIASSSENELDMWDGYANLGVNVSSGNTNQLDFTVKMGIQRRSSISRFKADYLSNYSQTDVDNDDGTSSNVITANSERLTSIYDWFFSQKVFLRLADFEYSSDEFINLDNRVSYGVSLGYHLIDSNKITWDATAGPSYQSTTYLNVQPNDDKKETSAALSLSTNLEYEISKDIDFMTLYQLQVVNEASGGLIHHFQSGFEVDFAGDFDLDVTFYLDRIEQPKIDEFGVTPEKNDYRLVFSLGYDF